jgi:hypothetical protein
LSKLDGKSLALQPHKELLSLGQWIRARKPECAIFVVGALLRMTMAMGWRYRAEWGYDAQAHLGYVDWILQHFSLPHSGVNYVAYHPPLYHALAAGLAKLGVSHQNLTWLSFACGIIRLGLIWCGLEWYLQSRRARIAALALVAVFPTSILIDGMVSNETMNGMFAAAAMLLWPRALQATGKRRWQFACILGFVFGLGALAKMSALFLLSAFGVGAALDLLLPPKQSDWQARIKAVTPWAVTVVICLAISGWFYARNIPQYRNPFITSYEVAPEQLAHRAANTPYLDRRTLGFVLGWDQSIYKQPYYPTGLTPNPRFIPVVLASTFVDYYNYSFSGLGPGQQVEGGLLANTRPMTPRLLRISRRAVIGGTIIMLGTLVAWMFCFWKTSRQRDWGLFSLLVAPLFATLIALSFAIKYPYDAHGVVKGVYIQFGAPPLYAMYGVAVAWSAAQRRRWPILALLLLGLAAVALYSIRCRFGLF